MTLKECLFEIFISITSSGGIAWLLWCLDRKREQKREKEDLEREAREILINNANEKEYLFLAQFGTFLNPED